jgi:hypothetical protein
VDNTAQAYLHGIGRWRASAVSSDRALLCTVIAPTQSVPLSGVRTASMRHPRHMLQHRNRSSRNERDQVEIRSVVHRAVISGWDAVLLRSLATAFLSRSWHCSRFCTIQQAQGASCAFHTSGGAPVKVNQASSPWTSICSSSFARSEIV